RTGASTTALSPSWLAAHGPCTRERPTAPPAMRQQRSRCPRGLYDAPLRAIQRDPPPALGVAAGAIDGDQALHIEGGAAELEAQLFAIHAEERVLCPGIGVEHTFGLAMAPGEADAAGVEVEGAAEVA